MRKIILFTLLFFPVTFAHAEDCKNSLQIFRNAKIDADQRSIAGQCLINKQLDRADVAQALLRAIKDDNEDMLLREDLMEAFSKANLRKKIKVEGNLSRAVDEQDKSAIGSVASGNTNDLLAVANAVKSMDEILPVTRLENEFFKAFSEIALNDANHVLLRAAAVDAMDKTSANVVESGVYDEKIVRMARETIRTMALRDDVYSYYSGAVVAYQNATVQPTGRRLSSQNAPIPAR